jgi:hypothetical protein
VSEIAGFKVDEFEPYDVTCAGCGKVISCVVAMLEEGDRWECPDCWEKFEAREREICKLKRAIGSARTSGVDGA